jgi:hypothetical protein
MHISLERHILLKEMFGEQLSGTFDRFAYERIEALTTPGWSH